jgi:glycosyltransferase involved in cell wall biosynthesis
MRPSRVQEKSLKVWEIFLFSYNSYMKNTLENKKVAIVCDWIKDWWGAELVLQQIMEVFPQADIFSSVFWQQDNPIFKNKKVTTSFIQKLPVLNTSHKLALTLRPQAFEGFDLSAYDIVISSTSAESKWVITKPDCLQICYCHTPTRYFWSHYDEYLNMMEFGLLNPLGKWLMPKLIKKLRKWDFSAAQRPDHFIANSKNTQDRISKYYKRESEVIYPSIDISEFPLTEKKEDYYLAVWRCIPYKKFDLLVEAFNTNGKKLIIATNTDNKLYRKLRKISKNNIEWKMNLPRNEIINLYSKAKCFVFPPEEDFGLVPQATGTPVIAYSVWWALETVVSQKTGVFFDKQTPENLQKAIDSFESMTFNSETIRKHAEQFDSKMFKENLVKFIENKLNS